MAGGTEGESREPVTNSDTANACGKRTEELVKRVLEGNWDSVASRIIS